MSKINKIEVGGLLYDIEDTTKDPIILDAGNYNVRRTDSALRITKETEGSKLIQEIREKFSSITETSDVYLRLKVNRTTVGTGTVSTHESSYVLFKANYIYISKSSGESTVLLFTLFDADKLKTSRYPSSAYNFQIVLFIPYDISSDLNYYLGYNEIQLAGRRYTNATTNNIMCMASRDVIFKDDTEDYTPTADTHPVNKKYVDNAIAEAIANALASLQ